MHVSPKKDQERLQLEGFRTACPDFPSGCICAMEQPDFIVHGEKGAIGIELTTYVRGQAMSGSMRPGGSPVRAAEQQRKALARRAEAALSAKTNAPIVATLHFVPREPVRKTELSRLAEAAADIITHHLPDATYEMVHLDWQNLRGTLLSGYVRAISIARLRHAPAPRCVISDASFISAGIDELQTLIDYKSSKVPEYRRKCVGIWLLIVAEGVPLSSALDLSAEVLQHQFRSAFDRVFVYDRLARWYRLLQTLPV